MNLVRTLSITSTTAIVTLIVIMTSLSIVQIREESVANFERSAEQESRHLDYALTQYFEQIKQNVTYIAEHKTTRSSLPYITTYYDNSGENEI